ncbi:LacI family DNA-binding transcriptional regulator [Thalassotalea sp. ND16A]|uniref:LacI family DNA-binding transcriptional regulator n=1 Tax=Thalassotalea sp. ND16A TaxID=1535422 RepID=UPI000519FF87|nr:LacI family DNA-binding transcriptional regulator [Thalassotalea sp. ND16A]KGK00117.1 hypothetical protein ND16A_0308 [Thalassotalea sp. ND16A]
MNVTIKEVAHHAQVCIKTVSRVLNNESYVKEETRERVLAAIEQLNYQPSVAARNLAGAKSHTIGFLYDNPNAYYICDMQDGILSACRSRGYELLISPCDANSPTICEDIVTMVGQSRVDGLILTPPLSEMPTILDTLNELDVHYVRIISGSATNNVVPGCVLVDDHQAAYQITKLLLSLGHQSIGFLEGDIKHGSSTERLKGFQAALAHHGINSDESLILSGSYTFESGAEGAKKLMALPSKPTAIFACNDEIAAGALFAARQMNIDIPKQLSIVGFEDSPFSRQSWPQLTTAHQPNKQISQYAAAMLFDLLRQRSISTASSVANLFSPHLVIRDSTGAAESVA